MMIIGYARVSTANQNLSRQVEDLKKFGCEKIFTEKQSGKNFKERTVYNKMRSKLRFGDVLVVHDLSRFGRNKQEIRDEWERLTKDEIDIVVLNMPILDTRKYKNLEGVGQLISDLVLTLLSWMVDEERERIRTAQREGIEIAKKKGKFKGKPILYHPNSKNPEYRRIYHLVVRMIQEEKPIMQIAKDIGISRNTVYRIKNELEG